MLYNLSFRFLSKIKKKRFVFRIFHKATADNETFSIIETRLLWARINNLKPNSQHVVYVVAIGTKGESLPSETLVAWTDPAVPAFVDVIIFSCHRTGIRRKI